MNLNIDSYLKIAELDFISILVRQSLYTYIFRNSIPNLIIPKRNNMSIFDGLIEQAKNAVLNRTSNDKQSNNGDDSLLGTLKDLLGQKSGKQDRQVRSASEDPHGDPADQNQSAQNQSAQSQYGNVRPASEDPYGDPADSENGNGRRNVRPASEDPYGDPADQ